MIELSIQIFMDSDCITNQSNAFVKLSLQTLVSAVSGISLTLSCCREFC